MNSFNSYSNFKLKSIAYQPSKSNTNKGLIPAGYSLHRLMCHRGFSPAKPVFSLVSNLSDLRA